MLLRHDGLPVGADHRCVLPELVRCAFAPRESPIEGAGSAAIGFDDAEGGPLREIAVVLQRAGCARSTLKRRERRGGVGRGEA